MLGEFRIVRSRLRTPSLYANLRPIGEVRIAVSECAPMKAKVHELREIHISSELAINPR